MPVMYGWQVGAIIFLCPLNHKMKANITTLSLGLNRRAWKPLALLSGITFTAWRASQGVEVPQLKSIFETPRNEKAQLSEDIQRPTADQQLLAPDLVEVVTADIEQFDAIAG